MNLVWNDAAIMAVLRTKLTPKIFKTIHLLCPYGQLKTFADLKKVAQDTENYIHIRKQT